MNIPVIPSIVKLVSQLKLCEALPEDIKSRCNFKSTCTVLRTTPTQVSTVVGQNRQHLIRSAFPSIPNVMSHADLKLFGIDADETEDKYVIVYGGPTSITVPFEYLTRQQQLQLVLAEPPVQFEQTGHVAHYNFFDELQEQVKYYIGACTLSPAIKTVILKTKPILNEFRTLDFELIGGLPIYETTVKQHGLTFIVDVQKVYFNSRLAEEHIAVADTVAAHAGDGFVFDATGGVGPFAIPLGKRGIKVICNDLNPDSYHYMRLNVEENGVSANVECVCGDARVLLEKYCVGPHIVQNKTMRCSCVILNLPELSVDFLTAVRNKPTTCMYVVETFSRFRTGGDVGARVVAAVFGWENVLGEGAQHPSDYGCDSLDDKQLQVVLAEDQKIREKFEEYSCELVRDVGTNKFMVRATFRLKVLDRK